MHKQLIDASAALSLKWRHYPTRDQPISLIHRKLNNWLFPIVEPVLHGITTILCIPNVSLEVKLPQIVSSSFLIFNDEGEVTNEEKS